MSLVKKALLGLLCGLITGAVILGAGGRIVMSVIALLGNVTPTWSLGGSVEVIVFGALVGAVVGLVYGAVRAYLPGSSLVKGVLAGLLLFGVMALLPPPSARSAMAGFDDLLLPVLSMFGVICVLFGVALAMIIGFLKRRLERKKI